MDKFADTVIQEFAESEKKYIFDVGANNGDQLIHWWHRTNWEFFLIEPTPSLIEKIAQKAAGRGNVKILPYAISNESGEKDFYVSCRGDGGCSSLQEFNPDALKQWKNSEFTVDQVIKVKVMTLSEVMDLHNIPRIDYLHIDAQGEDLLILQGLGDKINLVNAGQIEAGTDIRLYKSSATEQEAREFLQSKGFHIWNVYPYPHECNLYFRR